MFFNFELLGAQKGGRFAKVWIAATRGTESLSKAEILELNLQQIGDDIGQYIISTSAQPRHRFSLVLSSKLICGLARLYRQKAIITLDEVVKFLCAIRKPIYILSGPALEASEAKKRPKPKRTKQKAIESGTPDVNIKITPLEKEITDEELQIMLAETEAPKDLITLREADRTVLPPVEGEVFGFSTVGEIEALERTLRGPVEPSLIPLELPSAETVPIPAQEMAAPKEKRPRSPAEGDKLEKSKKRRIEAQPPKEVQTVEEIPIARQEEPVQVVEEEMEVVVEKPAVAPREQRVLEERTPKKMRVAKPRINKALVQRESFDFHTLNAEYFYHILLLSDERFPFKQIGFTASDSDTNFVLETVENLYADEKIENLLAEMALDSKSRDSLAASINSLRARSSGVPMKDVSSTLEVRTSEIPLVQIQEERMTAILEEEAPEQITLLNGREKPIQEITIIEETVMPPAAYINGKKGAIVDVAEIYALQEREKGKPKGKSNRLASNKIAVRAALNKWNWDQGFPTIEDICPPPLNRLNISLTFNNLLELHKQKYIILVGNPETLELEHIERGERFF